jgi:hypothetical protein
LAEWCAEIEADVIGFEPVMPVGIVDRAAECWEPLLTIADIAGGDWPQRAREAAVYLTGAAADDILTSGVELLAHIRDAFLEADKIWSSTLCKRLCERDESPWADIRGKPLDERGLAVRLKPYRVKSRDVKIDGTVRKGYHRTVFANLWKRYLTPSQTSATSATNATFLNNKNNLVAEVAEVAARTADQADYEERAAILEFNGGFTREEAEARAAEEWDWEIPEGLDRRRKGSI